MNLVGITYNMFIYLIDPVELKSETRFGFYFRFYFIKYYTTFR
jgi:hypothetical protein